jgi:hypothetical protein
MQEISHGKYHFKGQAPKAVDAGNGTIDEVSLIAVGQAKGHGLFVDDASLVTALAALRDKNLPAHITHADANGDRMLTQVGYFAEFYIDERKLKAKRFVALDSFRADEPDRYNRLFDLAANIPDTFGLSLVFEANIVMVMADGSEVPVADYKGKGAVRDEPSVRFVDIQSADFVDAPAANEEGLFSTKQNHIIMDEENIESTTEAQLADEPEVAPEENENDAAPAAEEEGEQEGDALELLKASVQGHGERLSALEEGVASLSEQLGAETQKKEAAEAELATARQTIVTLSKALDGAEPLAGNHATSEEKGPNPVEEFCNGTANQQSIWKTQKDDIFKFHNSLRRGN